MAAAPAIARFVGGAAEEAIGYTKRMYTITLARNNDFGIPALGFAGRTDLIDSKLKDSELLAAHNTLVESMSRCVRTACEIQTS
jgi:hypothetical protein